MLITKDYPVIVTKTENEILTKDTLEDFEIEGTKNNEKITLKMSELVQIEEANSLNSINREEFNKIYNNDYFSRFRP